MAEPTKIPVETPDEYDGFEQKSITIRGKDYTFRELSTAEYDDVVKKATDAKGELDTVQMMRWMIIKGSLEPKIDAAGLSKLPFGVVGQISTVINDLHGFGGDMKPLADQLEAAGWKVEPPDEDGETPKGS